MANDSNTNQAEETKQADAVDQAASQEAAGEVSVAELQDALAAARAETAEYKERVLRVSAEMENVRRRAAIDLENAHKFGLDKMASELLSVKDSLELGLIASSAENVEIGKVVEGMDLTLKMLAGMMSKFGITEVNPLNEKFNPDHHQAMSMQESAEAAPNTVINVFQKGYLLNERLLRPAMVVVSKAPSGGANPDATKIDEMA